MNPSQTEPRPAKAAESTSGGTHFTSGVIAVSVLFGWPLYELVCLSLKSELHSHLILIPVVSWYVWRFIDRKGEPSLAVVPPQQRGWLFAAIGSVVFAAAYLGLRQYWRWPVAEYLWAGVLAYLLAVLAIALRVLGWPKIKQHGFAAAFLLFFIPLPPLITDALSVTLQHGSAEITDWMLRLSGLPVLREGLTFIMPGLTVHVAEECSGVRSTLVLFITSLIAGKMFLRSGWKRLVLALLTIPLGLFRNALRITVLSWLTVHVDPGIIHGPLHHEGGPLFFVISLVPLFALLWYFRRSESGKSSKGK